MSTNLLTEAASPCAAVTQLQSSASSPAPTVPAFLAGYALLLLAPLLGLVAGLTGWFLTTGSGWPAGVAAVAAVAMSNGLWLHRRAWAPALTHLVTWAAPTVVLAPMAALGSLSPDGLVLWAPVATLLAVALAVSQDPRLASDQCRHRR